MDFRHGNQRGEARKRIENAEALVGDAESLPFQDETFEAVICGFGLFFFPDADRALGEIRRVLRPGGQLALSTFTRAGSDSTPSSFVTMRWR